MNVRLALWLLLGLIACAAGAQVPDHAAIYQQLGPQAAQAMQETQKVQEQYARTKQERAAERAAIRDRIAKEELDRAQGNAASLRSQGIDPLSAAEVATRKRLDTLQRQWKAEDAELEAKAQADMQKAMSKAGLMTPTPAQ